MPQTSINNFSEGMIQDLDKSLKSKNSYQYAQNLRYLANINDNTGTLHSVESTNVVNESGPGGIALGEYIVGHEVIRDYLVLFVSLSGMDRIIRYDLTETSADNPFEVYSGMNVFSESGTGIPEFLSTVGRYEDGDNVKVYFANKDIPIRVINIIENTTVDKNRLNLVTTVSTNSLTVREVIDGSLTTGRVDYGYSLIKKNGQESMISSGVDGNPVNLFESNISTSSTVNIIGDIEEVNTGKGVKLAADVSTEDASYFDKLRLYRIHYKEYGQLPEIVIVDDFDITQAGGNVMLDTGGEGLGTITPEEYAVLSNVVIKAYTIEEKDNVLFAANLIEDVFEIDFDARAYRFLSNQNCNLYAAYGSYGSAEYNFNGSGPWEPTAEAIPETANVINPYNDLDNDYNSTYKYIYQSDGTTLGGEGVNVQYEFVSQNTQMDVDNSDTDSIAQTHSGETNSSLYITNDFTSPIATHYFTTYQRDEVYRFGIILYDELGRKSSVKWVGDIRIPGPVSSSAFQTITDSSGSTVTLNTIGITFTLKDTLSNLGISAWSVVRAKREEDDRSVVASGYLASTVNFDTDAVSPSIHKTYLKSRVPVVNDTAYDLSSPSTPTTVTINNDILNFVSPEPIFFNRLNIKTGDYVDVVGTYDLYVTATESGGTYPLDGAENTANNYFSIKYTDLDLKANSADVDRYTIDVVDLIEGQSTPKSYSYSDGTSGLLWNSAVINADATSLKLEQTAVGRTVAIQLTSTFDNTDYTNFDLPYAYIKRNNTGRYNGWDYASRQATDYISASGISDSTTVSATKGDTYINYFDYLNYYVDHDFCKATTGLNGDDKLPLSQVIFPVESKINLSLRSDENFAKVYDSEASYLMRHYAGEYSNFADTLTYTQTKDLYLYNSVYSQESDIDTFNSVDVDIDFRTDLDTRVRHSDRKFDDEYIDSWTKFRPNNFLDVESKYGPIKSLKKYNNYLYFFQDKAFGGLSVNQRSLISDNNPGTLALGSGGTLERFDYINEFYGTQHKKSINSNKGGIYFFDKANKAILNYNGSTEVLSDSKGLTSYVNNLTLKDIPFITASNKNSEVYLHLSDNTLVFNNFTGTFISDYTYNNTVEYYGDADNFTFYNTPGSGPFVYGLYLGTDWGSMNAGTSYEDSLLELNCNDGFYNTKTFDNVLFFTSTIDSGIENNTDHFDSVRFWNDYQYTGTLSLTLGDTLESRERGYAVAIPRNIVSANGTTNIDIFNAANHDSSRQFKERMRDKYLTAEFTYNNSGTKGQLSVPYISFLYRPSKR